MQSPLLSWPCPRPQGQGHALDVTTPPTVPTARQAMDHCQPSSIGWHPFQRECGSNAGLPRVRGVDSSAISRASHLQSPAFDHAPSPSFLESTSFPNLEPLRAVTPWVTPRPCHISAAPSGRITRVRAPSRPTRAHCVRLVVTFLRVRRCEIPNAETAFGH